MAVIICEHSYELTTDFIKGRKALKRDENKIYLNPSQKEKALVSGLKNVPVAKKKENTCRRIQSLSPIDGQ